VVAAIRGSALRDITEFGRAVHAEMDALLACARGGIPTAGAVLFSTTFPCHNCAKHIVAAGISRVVFIEPYPKSKAIELHGDASGSESAGKVRFQPFVGIGPRRYMDLFSTNLSRGYPRVRKDAEGRTIAWSPIGAAPRTPVSVTSPRDREEQLGNLVKGIVDVS
jgi:cytidine deaminase